VKKTTSTMDSVRNGLNLLLSGRDAPATWSGMETLEPRLLLSGSTQWTGSVNDHWDLAGNWDNGVPDATTVAVFEGTAPTHQPKLYDNAVASGVDIQSAGWTIRLGNYVLKIGADGLDIAGGSTPTSKIDMETGGLIVNNDVEDPALYHEIQDLIKVGRGTQVGSAWQWNGQGIPSSFAAQNGAIWAVGVEDNAFLSDFQYWMISQLRGVSAGETDILANVTLYGDMRGLDNQVTVDDYNNFTYCISRWTLFNSSDIGWQSGDLDLNGVVNYADYVLFNTGLNYFRTVAAPTALTATAVSDGRIDLAWTDNAWNETGYYVEIATDANFENVIDSVELNANTQTYSDTGLDEATTYYYRVATEGDYEWSDFCEPASAKTLLKAPTDLDTTVVSSSRVDLTWTDNTDLETGYVIQRATDADFTQNLTTVTTTAANAESFSDTGLNDSTTYYYRVRAINATNHSAYSDSATAATPNAVPVVEVSSLDPADEGDAVELEFAITHPGPCTYVIQWGDGTTLSGSWDGTNPITAIHRYWLDEPSLLMAA
jgi:hypothetical protein